MPIPAVTGSTVRKPRSCLVRGLDQPRVRWEEVFLLFCSQWSIREHLCVPRVWERVWHHAHQLVAKGTACLGPSGAIDPFMGLWAAPCHQPHALGDDIVAVPHGHFPWCPPFEPILGPHSGYTPRMALPNATPGRGDAQRASARARLATAMHGAPSSMAKPVLLRAPVPIPAGSRRVGRQPWQLRRRGRLRRLWQAAASRACGRWDSVGLCLLLLFCLPCPQGTPPQHSFPGHHEQAGIYGDARAAGTVPGIPQRSGKTTCSWDL